jgi:hypothetical protein
MMQYHAAHSNRFPPAAGGTGNQPLLSWRVHLLPYLGEQSLYQQFHLNEAWNSPHNTTLLSRMPNVYRMPDQPSNATVTHYQVFVGPQAPFDGTRQLGMANITDGASRTIAIVEALAPVEWTRPADVAFPPDAVAFNGLGVLGRFGSPTFGAVLFDGTVTSYPTNMNPAQLKALITPNAKD